MIPVNEVPAQQIAARQVPAQQIAAVTEPEFAAGLPPLSVLDWRRRVASLYESVRAARDPAEGHSLWVEGRRELISTHPASPVPEAQRASYAGPFVADYRPGWRFEAEVDRDVPEEVREVVTGTDGTVRFRRFGVLHLPGLGDLDVWWLLGYGGGVFVPVKDQLAGRQTYGAGRYLLDTVKGADLGGAISPDGSGSLVVDLNFAYNPSCAYDPAWACPLAGPGNTLTGPVPVGELMTITPGP